MISGRRIAPGRAALLLVVAATATFLVAPILVIVAVSFNDTTLMTVPTSAPSLRWYRLLVESRAWREAAWLSLWLATAVAAAALALGVPAAYGLARGRFPGRRLAEAVLVSPMIVPTIVLALGLYGLLAPLRLLGTPAALFLGHTLLAIPVVVIIVGGAFRRLDPAVELAARSCGASFPRAFWHVVVPAARPAILSAGAFAFLVSFDEVVLTLFLGGPRTGTLPKKIWESVKFELDPSLTAVSTLLVAVSVAGVLIAELARRKEDRA